MHAFLLFNNRREIKKKEKDGHQLQESLCLIDTSKKWTVAKERCGIKKDWKRIGS